MKEAKKIRRQRRAIKVVPEKKTKRKEECRKKKNKGKMEMKKNANERG